MEIRCAIEERKPIILVSESDERHGAPDLSILMEEAPEDIRHIFTKHVAIPWYRDPAFREVSLEKICGRLITQTDMLSQGSQEDRALVYGSNGEPVFDDIFTLFCSFSGVPLPGSGRRTRLWCRAVRIYGITVLVCTAALLPFPEGPSFLDYRDSLWQVMSLFFFMSLHIFLLPTARLPVIKELVETRIKNVHMARQLRKWTRWLTFAAIASVVSLSFYQICWIPPLFAASSSAESLFQRVVSLLLGILFIPGGVIMQAQGWCFIALAIAIQMLIFMDLATSFVQLHSQIGILGIQQSICNGIIIQLNDAQMARFQCAYIQAWRGYRYICGRISWIFLVAWAWWSVSFALQLFYTVRSILGVPHSFEGRGGDNWPVVLRTGAGVLVDLAVLMPFFSSLCFARVRSWIPQLLFTSLATQSSAIIMLNELDLDFPVGPWRARSALFPYWVALIAVRIICWAREMYTFFA
jgi:hypothetical protein